MIFVCFPIGKKWHHTVSKTCALRSAERRRNFFGKIREPQRIISERIRSGVNINWLCGSLDTWREMRFAEKIGEMESNERHFEKESRNMTQEDRELLLQRLMLRCKPNGKLDAAQSRSSRLLLKSIHELSLAFGITRREALSAARSRSPSLERAPMARRK